MTRTFIALERNEALQSYLAETMRRLAAELPRLNWVKASTIHLTLAFLGELSDTELLQASLASGKAARAVAPFEYRLSRLGIFGSPRQPRVLWIGIEEPSGSLRLLQQALVRELQERGFAPDPRPYSPHLTLARCKASLRAEEQERLQRILRTGPFTPHSAAFPALQLSVMKSELASGGAKYASLADYPLGPG
jgi:2'-5' RNA ligase